MQIDEGGGGGRASVVLSSALRTGLETWFFLLEEASTINKKRPGFDLVPKCHFFSLSLGKRVQEKRTCISVKSRSLHGEEAT